MAELRNLQEGRCFYCDEPIAGRGHVDHFLAWSRWPNDAIENLVMADRCNLDKSDHLVTADHVTRWRHRLDDRSSVLRRAATTAGWRSDPRRSAALVSSTYSHIAPGTPLWRHGRSFDIADGPLFV